MQDGSEYELPSVNKNITICQSCIRCSAQTWLMALHYSVEYLYLGDDLVIYAIDPWLKSEMEQHA